MQSGRVRRRLLNDRRRVGQRAANRLAGAGGLDASERPNGVQPSPLAPLPQPLGQGGDGGFAALGQGRDGSLPHRRSHVVEPLGQALGRWSRPVELRAARVAWRLGSGFFHAINRAQDFRPPKLRRRATELVPTAGVEHEQTAIGVLDHVGRVKVGVGRGEKIGVLRAERRAVGSQHVALHAVQVELTGKQVAGEVAAEHGRLVNLQAARRCRAEVRHHRHQIASARVTVHHAVRLAVNSAVNGVHQSVALATGGVLEKCGGEKPLAARRKNDVHRVVHAANHHRLVRAARWVAAENMRGTRDTLAAAKRRIALLGERALAPVNPPVTAKVRPVQIVGTAGERLALEPLLPLVGHAVAVGISQPPNARGRGDVKRTVVPKRALGEHHFVGEHDGVIELPVAVAILQAYDAVRLFRELFLDRIIRAGRVGDVQPPLLIERGRNRTVNQRRPGDSLHREAVRHSEDRLAKRHLNGVGLGQQQDNSQASKRQSRH